MAGRGGLATVLLRALTPYGEGHRAGSLAATLWVLYSARTSFRDWPHLMESGGVSDAA